MKYVEKVHKMPYAWLVDALIDCAQEYLKGRENT